MSLRSLTPQFYLQHGTHVYCVGLFGYWICISVRWIFRTKEANFLPFFVNFSLTLVFLCFPSSWYHPCSQLQESSEKDILNKSWIVIFLKEHIQTISFIVVKALFVSILKCEKEARHLANSCWHSHLLLQYVRCVSQ